MSTEERQVYGVTLNFVYTRSHVSVSDEKVHIQSRASLFLFFAFISIFRKKKYFRHTTLNGYHFRRFRSN